jgi:hypothetical protein
MPYFIKGDKTLCGACWFQFGVFLLVGSDAKKIRAKYGSIQLITKLEQSYKRLSPLDFTQTSSGLFQTALPPLAHNPSTRPARD